MPSWSQPSREPAGPVPATGPEGQPGSRELQLMRRRFVEALRRAEIISLLSAARDEAELGRSLSEELCEVYDAEIGLLAERGEGGWRLIGSVGVSGAARERLATAGELELAAQSGRAVTESGSDLLGVGGRSCLLVGHAGVGGRQIVLGTVRLYPQDFDEAEIALLETIAVSTGQALERLWAHAERDRLIGQLKQSFVGTAEALANALEAKDNYTANHASEVADLAVEVGSALGLTDEELEDLRYGAIFHDIGKIAIPDAILNKEGPLAEHERRVMMSHPEIGEQIVAPIPFLSSRVREMVRHDHEHWDGSGYPDGLQGDGIPLGARIILVVDSYHAMISDRPYRKALSHEQAIAELIRCSGSQFDPKVVRAFTRIAG